MGTIKITVPDTVEERFRERAMELFGHGRGSMSDAGEEAITAWLAGTETTVDFHPSTLPIMNKRGALSDIDRNSVELQESVGEVLLDKHRQERHERSE